MLSSSRGCAWRSRLDRTPRRRRRRWRAASAPDPGCGRSRRLPAAGHPAGRWRRRWRRCAAAARCPAIRARDLRDRESALGVRNGGGQDRVERRLCRTARGAPSSRTRRPERSRHECPAAASRSARGRSEARSTLAAGDQPLALRPCTVSLAASWTMANRSPPIPFIIGATTPITALAAIAASTACPPRASTIAPACAASGLSAATIPLVEIAIDRACQRLISVRA